MIEDYFFSLTMLGPLCIFQGGESELSFSTKTRLGDMHAP